MAEVIQWSLLGLILLLLLGLYRQVGLLTPANARATTRGGPMVGRRLPGSLLQKLNEVVPEKASDGATLAFVHESCTGCQRLLSDLNLVPTVVKAEVVLVLRRPSWQFGEAVKELNVPIISDAEGQLWRECGITETPLVVRIGPGGRVLEREVTHDVSRVAPAKP